MSETSSLVLFHPQIHRFSTGRAFAPWHSNSTSARPTQTKQARSPQISVSARSHTRIQSINPRSSEPAGLCLCSHQSSHHTMKACHQRTSRCPCSATIHACSCRSSKELGAWGNGLCLSSAQARSLARSLSTPAAGNGAIHQTHTPTAWRPAAEILRKLTCN